MNTSKTSYAMALRIWEDRKNKSIAAATKWLKGEKPTEDKLEESRKMFIQYAEGRKEPGGNPADWTKEDRMYWWSRKVYNGMLIILKNKPIWR